MTVWTVLFHPKQCQRRGSAMLVTISVVLVVIVFGYGVGTVGAVCDRRPDSATAPKSSSGSLPPFAIKISDTIDTYEPGKKYTVTIEPTELSNGHQKFKEFLLTVQNLDKTIMTDDLFLWRRFIGTWTLPPGDDLSAKFSETCPNAITHTTLSPKFAVRVIWTAPQPNSGCVQFRATVVESRDRWYMDDGLLTKRLCEESQNSVNDQPPVLKRCCACNEAKYEIAFESLWSRNTHPKDFPSNHWITKFSDLIGASHSSEYAVWRYDDYASEGLKQIAEYGNTKVLESELKEKSDFIRTIIKARGIKYPNITEKTFAVFRVDSRNHLMSLVSKLVPSPDWIVGVANFELCQRNCTWLESKVVHLYPWDIGTDSGQTYLAQKQPTNPQKPIQRIPKNDPQTPFFDASNSANMKPLARLYIAKRQTYEKTCLSLAEQQLGGGISSDDREDDFSSYNNNNNNNANSRAVDGQLSSAGAGAQPGECQVTAWSAWSACSAQCGRGFRYRHRKYTRPEQHCNRQLTAKEICWGPKLNCASHENRQQSFESRTGNGGPGCMLTDWSRWSSCSVACGIGIRTRDRGFLNRQAAKKCLSTAEQHDLLVLQQNENCFGTMVGCENPDIDLQNLNLDCATRPWSEWSPCSATCGTGFKIRTRISLREAIEPPEASYAADESSVSQQFQYDSCRDEKTEEQVECQARSEQCPETNDQDIQKDDMMTQPVFVSGLHALGMSMPEELNSGHPQMEKLEANRLLMSENDGSDDGLRFEQQMNAAARSVNCVVSKWSKWTECKTLGVDQVCGAGYKTRFRKILIEPSADGLECPKLKKNKKCTIPCPDEDTKLDWDL